MMAELKAQQDTIVEFMQAITDGWDDLDGKPVIEIRALSEHGSANIARFSPDMLDMAADHAQAMNDAKRNVYMCINPVDGDADIRAGFGAHDKDILAALYCFADADTDGAMKNILSFAGPQFTMSVKTGTVPFTRGHCYWKLEEPVRNLQAWRETQQSIANSLKTDAVVINPSRIMRVAGTVSWPSTKKVEKGYTPELVTMRTQFSTDRDPVPFERMMRAFPPVKGVSTSEGDSPFSIDLGKQAMDRALAQQSIMQGEDWHHNVVRLVGSYVSKGLADAEIHAITDNFTQPPYTADDTRREVQQAIDGARAKGWTPEPQLTPQEVLAKPAPEPAPEPAQGFDIATQPTQPAPEKRRAPIFWAGDAKPVLSSSYLVKGWLGSEQMSVIYGPSNVGKSFFMLDMAFHVAAGKDWQGCKVKQGAVLYLATEGGNAFQNRVYALMQEHGLTDVPLAVRPAPVNLLNPEADLKEIADLCDEISATHGKIVLIVIDTLSRAMAGGNENGPEDMTAFIANVDALRNYAKAHAATVHHSGKDQAQGARGHSSLRAATDTEIELQSDERIKTATATKQRDIEPRPPVAFVLKVHELGKDLDGDAVTTCTIQTADQDDVKDSRQKRPTGRNQQALVKAFQQMRQDGIGWPNTGGTGWPESGKYWVIDAEDFTTFAKGKLTGTNPRAAFQKALDGLLSGGYMTQNDGYCWISAKEGRV